MSSSGALANAAVILGAAAALLKSVEGVLRPSESQKLREAFEAAYVRVDDSMPISVVRAPLRWTATLLDAVLGERTITKRALWRSSVASWLLLAVCLALAGLRSGHPLGFKEWPWEAIDSTITGLRESADTVHRQQAGPDETIEQKQASKSDLLREIEALDRFRSDGWKSAYTLYVVLGLLIATAGVSFVVLALSRHYLRTVDSDPSFIVLMGSLVVHLCLCALAMLVALAVFAVVTSPLVLYGVLSLVDSPVEAEWVALALLGIAVGAWFIGGVAIKTCALVAVWPVLLTFTAVIVSLVLCPFRRTVHGRLRAISLRLAEHPSGPLSPIVVALSLMAALAAYLAKVPM